MDHRSVRMILRIMHVLIRILAGTAFISRGGGGLRGRVG